MYNANDNTHSIVDNNIRLYYRIPILAVPTFKFHRLLSHLLHQLQQVFEKTSLTKCCSNGMICRNIRVYVEIFLDDLRIEVNWYYCLYTHNISMV